MRSAPLYALLFSLIAPTVASSIVRAEEHGGKLTLQEAERLALSDSPSLRSATARIRASAELRKAGISRMLPTLAFQTDFQHWDSAYGIAFDPTAPPIIVREENTNTFAAAANQPLLGLLRLVEEYRVQKENQAASEAQLLVAKANVRTGVRVSFLRYFEANAIAEIALQSEKELAEQVTIAQAKLKAGVLTNADLLRVQVAAANAKQQEIVGRTQAAVARATILITIGKGPDDGVELVEPTELLQAARGTPTAYSAAIEQALSARPDLRVTRSAVEASQHQQRARLYAMLPEINLQAGYTNIYGQKFAPPNAEYIGIKAGWLWDWGASLFGYRAARTQTVAAREDLEAQKRQVATEVSTDLLQSQSARSAVTLAEQSIASAAEAYRVTDALLKAGSATTTDLLESQSALSQARLNLVRAQYQLALAYVAMQRSMGQQ